MEKDAAVILQGLEVKQYPDRTLLAGVVGSTAYNLQTQSGSDIDTLGTFAMPADNFLGISPPGRTLTWSTTDNKNLPDATFHEIGKYVSLLLKNNPTVMELLWLPAYTVQTQAGTELIQMREKVLIPSQVYAAYGGYAYGELKKIGSERGSDLARVSKRARHVGRLCIQGTHLLRHGELPIDMGPYRDYLFDLSKWVVEDPQRFDRETLGLLAKLEKAHEDTHLTTDRDERVYQKLDELVRQCRKDQRKQGKDVTLVQKPRGSVQKQR